MKSYMKWKTKKNVTSMKNAVVSNN